MSIKNIRIVLVGPIHGGNVGQVCRAMKNMGLHDLVLVDPNPSIAEDIMTRKMSVSAYYIYEAHKKFDTLREAVGDCRAVACTSARVGLYRAHSATAREWAPDFLEIAKEGPVAVVFGREDHGLNNEELKLATHLVQIPTYHDLKSLNLAQSVLVCCYELFLATDKFSPSEEQSDDASLETRETMFDIWEQSMLDTGFCKEDKLEHMMMGLRRILSRGRLTDADARILMGLARQAQWAALSGRLADPDKLDKNDRNKPKMFRE